MSALVVKFPGIGRNFARIFKVYNHLIYWCLQEIRRKIMLFSMFFGVKTINKCAAKIQQAVVHPKR